MAMGEFRYPPIPQLYGILDRLAFENAMEASKLDGSFADVQSNK